MKRFFPLFRQLESVTRERLRGDLSAGVTVAVMLVPQGMAYALVAGLPPIYGLYAALVPVAVYAVLGTSRQLAVGPVAMVSLLVAAGVAPIANGDEVLYIGLAVLLSLMVGAIQFGLGLARFGFLTHFLSHPVLSGFTAAAALIIGFSQLKHLLGVDLARSHHVHEIALEAAMRLGEVHFPTLALGLFGVMFLIALGRWVPRAPGALLVVAMATLAAAWLELPERGVSVLGSVPGGLPTPRVPPVTASHVSGLLPAALTIALVGFMESIAVARVYATKHRYRVDANQELIALGAANLAGGFFQAYPATGGFSRTAVNDQAGARTGLAGLVSAVLIAATLLALTGLFRNLPHAALAAIVVAAVVKLIDWRQARFLWRVDRRDFWLLVATFVATLGLGIEQGILVGVAASLGVVVYQSSRPHTAVLGHLPGTASFRNLERHPSALCDADVVIFRHDASLYFANADHFKDRLAEVVRRTPRPAALVLDFYGVNRMDSTGLHALEEALRELEEAGVAVWFAGVKGPVMDRLRAGGLAEQLGGARFHLETIEAVRAARAALSSRGIEPGAPAASTAPPAREDQPA